MTTAPYRVYVNVDSFDRNTKHLTTGQHGALMRLIMECSEKGSISADNLYLASLCVCSKTRWLRRYAEAVLPFFVVEETPKGRMLRIDRTKLEMRIPCGSHAEYDRLHDHMYNMRGSLTPELKRQIFARDNYTCQYCDANLANDKPHCDHVIPVSQFGTSDPDNLVTSCQPCNSAKGDRTPEQWRAGVKAPALGEA